MYWGMNQWVEGHCFSIDESKSKYIYTFKERFRAGDAENNIFHLQVLCKVADTMVDIKYLSLSTRDQKYVT